MEKHLYEKETLLSYNILVCSVHTCFHPHFINSRLNNNKIHNENKVSVMSTIVPSARNRSMMKQSGLAPNPPTTWKETNQYLNSGRAWRCDNCLVHRLVYTSGFQIFTSHDLLTSQYFGCAPLININQDLC